MQLSPKQYNVQEFHFISCRFLFCLNALIQLKQNDVLTNSHVVIEGIK